MATKNSNFSGLKFLPLLSQDYVAKLSDFGLAKDAPQGDATHITTRVMGTHGYAAPEYILTGVYIYAKKKKNIHVNKYVHIKDLGFVWDCWKIHVRTVRNYVEKISYLFSYIIPYVKRRSRSLYVFFATTFYLIALDRSQY